MKEQLELRESVKSKAALADLEKVAKGKLKKIGFKPQYITVARQTDLLPAKKGDQDLVILAAASIGKARLIDNLEVALGQAD